jgi:hypothetical protein
MPKRTRSLACKMEESTHASHDRYAEHAGIPCAMVYGLYALSPVSGRFSHRFPGLLSLRVDPSVGRSRPRDFAVRISALRLPRSRVHRIPLPTSVTIAIRPSWWRRDARIKASDLPDAATAIACDRVTRRAICAWRPCAAAPLSSATYPAAARRSAAAG